MRFRYTAGIALIGDKDSLNHGFDFYDQGESVSPPTAGWG
jgi:hypothetical protein